MVKDLTEGLVLDLDMNNLQDYSGNSNDGTATGTTLTTDKDGRLNQARTFTSDNIDCGGNAIDFSDNELSIAFWYNADTATATSTYISKDLSFVLRTYTSNTFRLVLGNGGSWFSTDQFSTIMTTGQWDRVLITWDGSNKKVYVNGVLKDTLAASGNLGSNSNNIHIGSNGSSANYYSGDLSAPKVWNRSLSAEEVWMDYSETSHNYAGLFDGLVAGYDFKGDAKDFSGNENDGTVTSATLAPDMFGIADSAYDFDGTNDLISVDDVITKLALSSTGTISALVNNDDATPSSSYNIFSFGDTNGNAYIITELSTNGKMYVVCGDGGTKWSLVTDSVLFTTDTWQLFTLVHDGTEASIWLNGIEVASTFTDTTDKTYWVGDLTGVDNARIGSRSNNNSGEGKFFKGSISGVYYFDRVPLTSELKTIYDLLSIGYIYPFPKENLGGITQ